MKKRGKRALLFLSTIMLVCGLVMMMLPGLLYAGPFDTEITSYSLIAGSTTVSGEISGSNILVTVPSGTDVKNLIANFTVKDNKQKVYVNDVLQVSGTTKNDFTSPVGYLSVSNNGREAYYTVTVTIAPAPPAGSADKTGLLTAIENANANRSSVTISPDLPTTDYWVDAETASAYETAIGAAQIVMDDDNADQAAVDEAISALAIATEEFTLAKVPGTLEISGDNNLSSDLVPDGPCAGGTFFPGNYTHNNIPSGLLSFTLDPGPTSIGFYPSDTNKIIEITEIKILDKDQYGIVWKVADPAIMVFIVSMKGGSNTNLYTYASGTTGGTNCTLIKSSNNKNYGISHIVFGYTKTPPSGLGQILINKIATDGLTGTFNFEVTKDGDTTFSPIPVSITIDADNASPQSSGLITGLEPGDYTVTELAASTASTAFTIPPAQTDTVVADVTTTFTFTNTPTPPSGLGQILINKIATDGLTGTFNFEVTKDGDTTFSPIPVSITIDADNASPQSSGLITGLEPGDYTVTELAASTASTAFTIPPAQTDTVVADVTTTFTFTNTPTIIGVAGIFETRNIEVLGISELPFTGYEALFKAIGGALLFAGLGLLLYALRNKKIYKHVKH